MKVHTATLAGGDNNQDRIFVTDNAVIVLDGASAFEPVDVDPGIYAETIGAIIAEHLDTDHAAPVAETVATAIGYAVQHFNIKPGVSPSSTVSVSRERADALDLYTLGDTEIHYGWGSAERVITDNRLELLLLSNRERYKSRLRDGRGYNSEHQTILRSLQLEQRKFRNICDGYWTAEALPCAAYEAYEKTIDAEGVDWIIHATDGFAGPFEYSVPLTWRDLVELDDRELQHLLYRLHEWESLTDPHGQVLPRAKQHDDKSVAVVSRR